MSISSSKSHFIVVNIWETEILKNEPGHASLSLFKKACDELEGKEKEHFGFWPNREFAVYDIPFGIPGKKVESLNEEIHWSNDEPAFVPTKKYHIQVSKKQYRKMKNEMKKLSENINSGNLKYTWLVSLNTMVYDNLISGRMFHFQEKLQLHNCATIVSKILNEGDIPVKMSHYLWGISPSALGSELDRLICTDQIKAECFEQIPRHSMTQISDLPIAFSYHG